MKRMLHVVTALQYVLLSALISWGQHSLVSGFQIALLPLDGTKEPEWLESQGSNTPTPFTM
jgi:hypothetical protein